MDLKARLLQQPEEPVGQLLGAGEAGEVVNDYDVILVRLGEQAEKRLAGFRRAADLVDVLAA